MLSRPLYEDMKDAFNQRHPVGSEIETMLHFVEGLHKVVVEEPAKIVYWEQQPLVKVKADRVTEGPGWVPLWYVTGWGKDSPFNPLREIR